MTDTRSLPVQVAADERDLRRVVLATYAYAAIIGIGILLSAFQIGWTIVAGLVPSVWWLMAAGISLLSASLYAYANVRSAQAITAKQDLHFSFFVAGLNCMAFPIGTVLSLYSWRVLARPSVRDAFGLPQISGSPGQPAKPTRKPALKVVPDLTEHPDLQPQTMTFHEAMAHAEDAEEEVWRKLEEEHQKSKDSKSADET